MPVSASTPEGAMSAQLWRPDGQKRRDYLSFTPVLHQCKYVNDAIEALAIKE
jgi:hypothetical protein